MLTEEIKKTTKHQELVERLISLTISSPKNERFLTEAAICRNYDVSRMTARKAVDELVRKGLLYRIQGSGTYVTPHEQKQRGIKYLLPVPDFFKVNPYGQNIHREYINTLAEETVSNNCRVELIPISSTNEYGDISGLKSVDLAPEDPVIISNPWFAPAFEYLLEHKCRCIFLEDTFLRHKYRHFLDSMYHMQVDVEEVGAESVKTLYNYGRRRIAVLKRRFHDDYTIHPLYQGYLRGLEECSLPVIPELYSAVWPDEDSVTSIISLYKKYKFDALLLYGQDNNNILENMNKIGLKVPEDISCINCFPPGEQSDKISFYKFPYQEMVKKSIKIALAENFMPGREIFKAQIVDKGSIY